MASRQSVYQKRRRKHGKCGYGGCGEITGDRYYCQHHSDVLNAIRRARRAERQQQAQPEAA